MSKIFIISLVALISYGVSSAQQNCACTEFEKTANDENIIEKLKHSSSLFCKALGYELQAKDMLKRKEFDSAVSLLDAAIKLYNKNNCDEFSKLSAYKLYTNIYFNKADFKSALEYDLKILSIQEVQGNSQDIANGRLVVADIFNRMKQMDKGIEYARSAIPFIKKLPSSVAKAELLNKLTARYLFYAKDKKEKKYYDTADIFVRQALNVSKEMNDKKGQIIALTRLNDIAIQNNDKDLALAYIDQALQLCEPDKHTSQLATLYGDKADIYMAKGNYKDAAKYADSFLYYCKKDAFPPMIANAYDLKYNIESKAGNYKAALDALLKANEIKDSITTYERTQTVTELEKKYNQARNENTIKELKQQQQIYLLLAGAGFLGLITVVFFLRQQSLKHKHTILETEQRLNRARMNPHFFFNALATLQNFALRENDGKALAGNLSKFSHIMRETLESTYTDYVTIEQETEFLNEYIELQKIRYPQKFTYNVHAAEEVETNELLVPSMIIQPFVENSIEHGFAGIDYPGYISVFFSKEKDNLLITITDNGKGLLNVKNIMNDHISRASQIIKDRIFLLNIKLKSKAGFSIDDNPAGVGVQVKIILPAMFKPV